jgi:serine/threonine protein kinase
MPAEETLPQVSGYEIQCKLGHGGMGVVFKARQMALNRWVALKMILNADFADREAKSRFQREAEAVARLQHPNGDEKQPPGAHHRQRCNLSVTLGRVF